MQPTNNSNSAYGASSSSSSSSSSSASNHNSALPLHHHVPGQSSSSSSSSSALNAAQIVPSDPFGADLDAWVVAGIPPEDRIEAARRIRNARHPSFHQGYYALMDDEPPHLLSGMSVADKLVLNLRDLHLTSLPECIGELGDIMTLDLSGNALTKIPHWLGKMKNLDELIISNNNITEITETLANIQSNYERQLYYDRYFAQSRQLRLYLQLNDLEQLLSNESIEKLKNRDGYAPDIYPVSRHVTMFGNDGILDARYATRLNLYDTEEASVTFFVNDLGNFFEAIRADHLNKLFGDIKNEAG